MRAVDIIEKKKKNNPLTKEEIDFMVQGYTQGQIPDYQMAAFLMTIYFNGMNYDEIANMTESFVNSGDSVDLSRIHGVKVDKHSTGGVGDKISIIVIPLVALCGVPVAKMSGRGLGHTGGTIDKLESIEGFRVELSPEEFIENVNTYKMAIVGQTANLTPADKKIYALRDVTATIDSIPLIASSIMSKKIASGADAIVLDVKVGSGAFMKNIDEARELAKTMVSIGKNLNRNTIAIITNMDQPLGHEVGNSNEVKEAIKVLSGKGAKDETEVALTIASYMCLLGGAFDDFEQAYKELETKINSGLALEKLKELILIQGGNPEVVDNPDLLPKAKNTFCVYSEVDGYVNKIDAELIGISAMLLGAGRKTKEDSINYGAGISLKKKIGDYVRKGEVLCELHTDFDNVEEATKKINDAYTIKDELPEPKPYVYEVIQ
ncbi:pyrimidine-nucleoside phosphorylase [Soehngenia longivitae]|uniref:Pyrimidine-nucleoside phosphorylase n=1 Tax=Soehngenia longivitae TaxID=2562294 RepID=A0A4Z0D5E6_9FIRM|nr:pyrimidine-nucleoside phosphorylase [Soehngenia longivitae]TFZ39763.1 pyrimidine-nucleoside phosphorylase [Soehngenia longivitae]